MPLSTRSVAAGPWWAGTAKIRLPRILGAALLGGAGGYLCSEEEELSDIRRFLGGWQ